MCKERVLVGLTVDERPQGMLKCFEKHCAIYTVGMRLGDADISATKVTDEKVRRALRAFSE